MERQVKGTVTSLSSMFPVEEAQKASKRVEETISERQKQLDQLREFIGDNNSLINLVHKLPDQLHHDIMVPFGKAAFFPGRLIHTNEFRVLLGEGYYAERTAKQTIDILNRRGKALDVQVESVKALMQDLKAEASFFDATASEAAEGLVEIREDYVEETSPKQASTIGMFHLLLIYFLRIDSRTDIDVITLLFKSFVTRSTYSYMINHLIKGVMYWLIFCFTSLWQKDLSEEVDAGSRLFQILLKSFEIGSFGS